MAILHLLRRELFRGSIPFFAISICLLDNQQSHADWLVYENSGYLEKTIVRSPIQYADSRDGYVFLATSQQRGTDVLTNDLSPIAHLQAFSPIEPLPGGGFVGISTEDTNYTLLKFDARGTNDPSFSAPVHPSTSWNDLAAQIDGKIIIASTVMSFPPPQDFQLAGLFRLNADGSHDEGFQIAGQISAFRILLQPDGKILVLTDTTIKRFLSTGSADPSFHSPLFDHQPLGGGLQPKNGSIIVFGSFTRVDGALRNYLVRISQSGFVDSSFNAQIPDFHFVNKIGIQSNGDFVALIGTHQLFRYFADGGIDRSFNPPSIANDINGFGIDMSDKVVFNVGDEVTLVQYSGRRRIRNGGTVSVTNFDQVLEGSPTIGPAATWSPLKAVPANTVLEYSMPDQFGAGNQFFRLRPTP